MYSLQQYLSIAEKIISKMGPSSLLTDENIGYVAQFAMMRESKFDPSRGISKKQYVSIMMSYAVKKLRYLHKNNRNLTNCQSLIEFSHVSQNPAWKAMYEDIIDVMKKKMNPIHYNAIFRYFLNGMTLQEIASEDGCSRENVRQLISLGLEKARELVC